MKFLCDRCKTRYSIGDDRVRGKILKIRCKNCANVITVREGMDAGEDAPAGRRRQPTVNLPSVQATAAPAGALSAAFASQMSKPPPALEEEWYVSQDGNQAGPFSLNEAQRWVAAKPYDAELHCWSEGFDDWLAVDKVSHFRGLRKKPQPIPAPPPLPRAAPRLKAVEEEPKPLFAATLAALEKGSGAVRIPAVAQAPAPAMPAKPGLQAKTNGAGAPAAKGTASTPAIAKGNGAGRAPVAAKAFAPAFDVNDDDPADSHTQIEPAPFVDDFAPPVPRSQPIQARAARSAPRPEPEPDEDNLDIGEVSRVVNLADLSRTLGESPRKRTARAPVLRNTPVGRNTASVARMSAPDLTGNAGVPGLTGPFQMLDPVPSESIVARAPVEASRRGMIILLAGAALLLAGVAVAVVLILTSGNDDAQPNSLGHTREIDTSRPEDIVRKVAAQATGGTGATSPRPPSSNKQRFGTASHPTTTGPDPETMDPSKRSLDGDEVQDMAAKQSEGTTFCYKRAQRGALGIEIADLKRLDVTLTIDKEGTVNDVQLSSHAADSFGSCIMARVRGWKFRQSSGTKTFRVTLVFAH